MESLGVSIRGRLGSARSCPLIPSDWKYTVCGKWEEKYHAHGSVHVGERRGGHGEVSVDHLRGKVG